MAEWLKAAVLKTVRGVTPSWVRILLPPLPHCIFLSSWPLATKAKVHWPAFSHCGGREAAKNLCPPLRSPCPWRICATGGAMLRRLPKTREDKRLSVPFQKGSNGPKPCFPSTKRVCHGPAIIFQVSPPYTSHRNSGGDGFAPSLRHQDEKAAP